MEAYQTALTAFTGITVINFPEKIKTPTIAFVGGKLKFGCETAGVTYHYQIVPSDAAQGDTDGEVEVSAEYTVKGHASKEGWIDSDEATLCFNVKGIKGDVNEDGKVNIIVVLAIANYIINIPQEVFNFNNGDTDFNNTINVIDMMWVVNYILAHQ
jgi:hypothetical protein